MFARLTMGRRKTKIHDIAGHIWWGSNSGKGKSSERMIGRTEVGDGHLTREHYSRGGDLIGHAKKKSSE